MKRTALYLMIVAGLFVTVPLQADTVTVDAPAEALENGLVPGETLKYSVTFSGLSGGEMKLKTREQNGEICTTIRVQSGGFLGLFYEVDDQLRSCVNAETYEPLGYRLKQNHGGDKETEKVTYADGRFESTNGDSGTIENGVYDFTSIVYALRGVDLEAGNTYVFRAHNGETSLNVTLSVGEKQEIATFDGYKDAYRVQPSLDNGKLDGILNEDMVLFYDAEPPHSILKIEVPANIGTGRADLNKAKR